MLLEYPVLYVQNPTEEDHAVIFNGINNFAQSQGMNATAGSYFFGAYNKKKELLGAISGFDNFGSTEIGDLWVSESLRAQGYGHALIKLSKTLFLPFTNLSWVITFDFTHAKVRHK